MRRLGNRGRLVWPEPESVIGNAVLGQMEEDPEDGLGSFKVYLEGNGESLWCSWGAGRCFRATFP